MNTLLPGVSVSITPAGQSRLQWDDPPASTGSGAAVVAGGLLGLAIQLAIIYGAAYYGARAGVKAR